MKKMTIFVVIVVVGLLAGGCLVYRGIKRAPLYPHDYDHQPMNQRQGAVKIDDRSDYTTDEATRRRLMEKLRQEEIRQRPQEGRN